MIENKTPKPFGSKKCTESHGDSYKELDTCRRPLRMIYTFYIPVTMFSMQPSQDRVQ
jgi:hypothetical protein